MKNLTVMILFLFVSMLLPGEYFKVYAQVNQEWVAIYDGPLSLDDEASAMVIDSHGNVYVTGSSVYSTGSSWDYVTIKYNSDGVEQWVARYDGPASSFDRAQDIAVDSAGNVFVTGRTDDDTGVHGDYATVMYDSSGIEQWVAIYDGPDGEIDGAEKIAVDGEGHIYITGYSDGIQYDYATIRYDYRGTELWVARYNGPVTYADSPEDMAIDRFGNIIVTGRSPGSSPMDDDWATVKYSTSGDTLWEVRYASPDFQDDRAAALAIDANGNVYVTGESSYDYLTIKYSPSGEEIWTARYNNNYDYARDIALDRDRSIYVTGNTSLGAAGDVYATVKYDSSGVEQWVAIYDPPGSGEGTPVALTLDNEGDVYVTGYSYWHEYGTNCDFITIKYNRNGEEQWIMRYTSHGESLDQPNSIAIDDDGNVYVSGSSWTSAGGYNYITIKYNQQPSAIDDVFITLDPNSFALHPSLPNPFNSTTMISYQLPALSFVNLSVYDIAGRKVAELINGWREAGFHKVSWDASDLTSSLYITRLKVGDFIASQKMVLVK